MKFSAIVTDNAANMQSLRREVKENYPNIVSIGCTAHWLNLLILDITSVEEVKNLYLSAQNIAKE